MRRYAKYFSVVVVLALGVWALLIEPRRLVVRHVDLTLPRWPACELRIALLSDLHVGSPHWGRERLERLVDETNAEHADLVLLAGDYLIDNVTFGRKVEHESIAQALGRLHAPLGVVAVLGNHDWWNDGARMRSALESQRIVVLENEVHTIDCQGKPLTIAGFADRTARYPLPDATFAKAPADTPILALMHSPDTFAEMNGRPVLSLAGHTHGGQVRLPFFGAPVVASDYGQRFTAGHIVEGDRHLFVTSGIGTSIFPVRFGVPPEIVVLRVRH